MMYLVYCLCKCSAQKSMIKSEPFQESEYHNKEVDISEHFFF
jgi:hypothetical protein